jgi:Flp pilus assembly protein CpaB
MCQVSVPPAAVPDSPVARRDIRSRWRDPRLALGVLLVLASVLVGARVLARADDTTPVWAATKDLPAGSRVSADDVEVVDVSLGSVVDRAYLSATAPLSSGLVLTKPVAAHELLARTAIDPSATAPVAQLPLGVESSSMPGDLAPGDTVDVWVVPASAVDSAGSQSFGVHGTTHAVRVLQSVIVVATDSAVTLGSDLTRDVVVGLGSRQVHRLGTVLPRIASGTVVLVRHGG